MCIKYIIVLIFRNNKNTTESLRRTLVTILNKPITEIAVNIVLTLPTHTKKIMFIIYPKIVTNDR